LGLPPPQPRQVRAAERHALIREIAAVAGLHGWDGAAVIERILAGGAPTPPGAQRAVARLRAEHYAIRQRQVYRALALTDTKPRVCVSGTTPGSMRTSSRRRISKG
jgi:hypothetical protein